MSAILVKDEVREVKETKELEDLVLVVYSKGENLAVGIPVPVGGHNQADTLISVVTDAVNRLRCPECGRKAN